uniref:Uncharacterized protein n=1 Tax=Arundo donax TaxID=35708 RepID=A0A0A8ZT39_ARUDO
MYLSNRQEVDCSLRCARARIWNREVASIRGI